MPFTTLSPQETELVARLCRMVSQLHEGDLTTIVELLGHPQYSSNGDERKEFTIDDFIFLEGKVFE